MSYTFTTIDEVDAARDALNASIDAYLRKRGWKNTCSNPASLWLWEMSLPDGRVILTDSKTALAFERNTFDGGER